MGKHYSLLFLPATPSSPSWTLEGLFELTRRPSRALDSPRAFLPELQRYKDTVRCAAIVAEVPRQRQQQLMQTLDCAYVESALFLHRSLTVKSQQNRIELVTRPGSNQCRLRPVSLWRNCLLPLSFKYRVLFGPWNPGR